MITFGNLRKILVAGAVALACGLPCEARAQAVGDIVYTVGTTARDSNGQHWAYILWQATQPAILSNRVFAVYAKPGDATNPAPYVRKSIVMLQTDARVIEPLLRRAANLGDDLFKLQDDLYQLFGTMIPSNAIVRADQLSAVIRGSLGDPRHYQNLLLLARNHASINLALGLADAELIPAGLTTFEIRAYDMTRDQDLAVIGRVTVEAGNPTVLPAPGPPVLVPEVTAMGDLNLKFRWGTPDDLRRLGLMQFGYNLFRIDRAYANSKGWNAVIPPPLTDLHNLVNTNPAVAKRVNHSPITPRRPFTLAEAADLTPPTGDARTFFMMDDDGRGRNGYINYGFQNGAQYYYYVAGRDVLGRDGRLSLGLLATVCDRMPPLPPTDVHVLNDYTYDPVTLTSNQSLRVVWKQAAHTNDVTTNYWIYRWTSITQMNALSGDISNHLVAVVPHIVNATYNNYLDNGPGSPNAATDLGKTYWYTVRGGDAGPCGQNLSGTAGPAFGVLRDRIGPAGGTGFIDINCTRPFVRYVDTRLDLLQRSDPTNFHFLLTCTRRHPQFEWAEFYGIANYQSAGGPVTRVTNYFGRLYYLTDPTVSTWWLPARPTNQTSVSIVVRCRAGLHNGKISDFAVAAISELPDPRTYAQVDFEAYVHSFRTRLSPNQKDDCREHDPTGGGSVIGTNNIGLVVFPTVGSKKYRIYRRVDDGPISLLCQGPVTNIFSIIECFENAPPVNGGTVCFYFQLLDEHGNPGPMSFIGCVDTAPNTPLPVPILTKLTPTGNGANPGMNISWFCPPYGVDRFEVNIAGLPTPPDTNDFNLSSQLSFTKEPAPSMTFSNFGTNLTLNFYPYHTPKAGPAFGNNGAQFVINANIQLGKTYIVTVRALGKNGNAGDFSNFETFVWNPTNAPIQEVPWPARGVPSTSANFPALAFFLSPTNPQPVLRTGEKFGNAVLLGFIPLGRTEVLIRQGPPRIYTTFDPMDTLLTNEFGQVILPLAMYRWQVPNGNFPSVSGDVTQVSPLMEKIAYEAVGGAPGQTVIHDPFITATGFTDNSGTTLYLWLRDTQPQIAGARYRYALVRFKPNREIDQIIQSNEVEVP